MIDRIHFMRKIVKNRKEKSLKDIEKETLDFLMKEYIKKYGLPDGYNSLKDLIEDVNKIHYKTCCEKIVSK